MPTSLRDPLLLAVADPSQIGEARRASVGLAERLGFDETRLGGLAIVLTELATNLLKHAGGGELIVRGLDRDGVAGVEVLAVDRGPGIGDVGRAMRDGFSTGGTAGTGLGAIRRLAGEFDLYSVSGGTGAGGAGPVGPGPAALRPPRATAWAGSRGVSAGPPPGTGTGTGTGTGRGGTVLMARAWAAADPGLPPGGLELGVVCLPMPGEEACGDAWALAVDDRTGRAFLVVADGLGHGPHAAEASGQAVRLFRQAVPGTAGPAAVLKHMHDGLRGTRGAAVAVVELPPPATAADARPLRFAGVGNIAASVVGADGAARSAISHNGTLGVEARRFQEFDYPAEPGGLLVLHSDGLGSRWQLGDYVGLRARHPAVVAGVLYRDQRRARDDATVLVVRLPGPPGLPGRPPGATGGAAS